MSEYLTSCESLSSSEYSSMAQAKTIITGVLLYVSLALTPSWQDRNPNRLIHKL